MTSAGGEAHHSVEPTRGGFRDARTVKGLGEKVINIIFDSGDYYDRILPS